MIRLIIILLGLLAAWIVLSGSIRKKNKVFILLILAATVVTAVWYEQASKAIRDDIVEVAQVQQCGLQVQHSYRTNYKLVFCLRNTLQDMLIRRVKLRFTAQSCIQEQCDILQQYEKSMPIHLAPGQSLQLQDSLDFKNITPQEEAIFWKWEVLSVSARPYKN